MSTKDDQKTQELQGVFLKISDERELREWEQKNRNKILESAFEIQRAFDEHWLDITGDRYFQPVTMAPPSMPGAKLARSDPKSRSYRANVEFSRIMWVKIRRKFGKRFKDLFILQGEADGKVRPIFQNLTEDRLRSILEDATTDKILKAAKKDDRGEIEGEFNLLVEGYWEVIFAPMKGESDTIDVELTWEGQCLLIKRQMAIVLPGFYIEQNDNATKDHYTQTPEQGRKKIGTIQQYSCTVLREATMEEYLAQKESGDKIMRAKIDREG